MQLALDIGNTRIKWGLREQRTWRATGAFPTAAWPSLEDLLRKHAPLSRVLASQVAGPGVAKGIEQCCAAAGIPLLWVTPGTREAGITSRYDPLQLGADRWVALIGARALVEGPAIVVNAGTATTIDALSASGEFLGGVILPGLTLMREALARGTAALPDGHSGRFSPYPGNTGDAMVTGSILATVGAIQQLSLTLQGSETASVSRVISGGQANALLPHLKEPAILVEHLVLEGLARLMSEHPDH